MELDYQVEDALTKVFYGETLVSQLRELSIDQPILFLTNQRYYDLFADKITRYLQIKQTMTGIFVPTLNAII